MTTSQSPLKRLRAQAEEIAAKLKAMERGEAIGAPDPAGKIAGAKAKGEIKFAVVMDDKIIKITVPWSLLATTDETVIAEWILAQMREERTNT